MSNFKLKKSEFMELNLNKKVVSEAEEKELTSTELEEIKPEDEESKEEETESKTEETKEVEDDGGNFKDVIAEILHSRTQSHIFHWQTTGEHSLAMHQALQLYYEGVKTE